MDETIKSLYKEFSVYKRPVHFTDYKHCEEYKPRQIRCDNGPEYISGALAKWAETHRINLAFIQPGNPQQNAYAERYNRTVRYDWLAQYLFGSIAEVQEHATHWLWTYNNTRPNMALGGITPAQKLQQVA